MEYGMEVEAARDYVHAAMGEAAAFISRSLPDGIALGLYNEAEEGARPMWVLIDEVASGEAYNDDYGAVNYRWLETEAGEEWIWPSIEKAMAAAPKDEDEAATMRLSQAHHHDAVDAARAAANKAQGKKVGGEEWRAVYADTYKVTLERLDREAYAAQLAKEQAGEVKTA